MNLITFAALFFAGFLLTILATGTLLPWLRRRAMFDQPNERSSHVTPTLHGGGLALTTVVILLLALLWLNPFDWRVGANISNNPYMLIATAFLAFISWLDDVKSVSQINRLIVHFIAVAAILIAEPNQGLFLQGLVPLWLDRIIAGILWVWFINLFNFMDGIDGISGVETASIGMGVVVLASMLGWEPLGQTYALVLTGAGIGFLWWNWHPAKVFLGDVGSVPLGFLLGWLLLNLAAEGYWVQSLILPFYYLADATLTLVRRLTIGEKVWEAHREHYYQQAVRKGFSHAKVVSSIAVTNAFLIVFSVISLWAPATGLVGAATVVFALLLFFKYPK